MLSTCESASSVLLPWWNAGTETVQKGQPDREIHVILWLPGGKNDAKTPGCKCVTEEGEKSQVTHQKSSSQWIKWVWFYTVMGWLYYQNQSVFLKYRSLTTYYMILLLLLLFLINLKTDGVWDSVEPIFTLKLLLVTSQFHINIIWSWLAVTGVCNTK